MAVESLRDVVTVKRCICVYQRTGKTTWALRLIHPKCPRHGGGTTWKAIP